MHANGDTYTHCNTCRTAQRGGVAGCQTTNTFQTIYFTLSKFSSTPVTMLVFLQNVSLIPPTLWLVCWCAGKFWKNEYPVRILKKLYISRCRAFSLLLSVIFVSLLSLLASIQKKKKKMHGKKNYKKKHYAFLKISSSWYPMKNYNSQYCSSRPTLIVQIFRMVLSLHCSSEWATWSKTPNTNCRELFTNWVLRHLGSTGSALAYVQSHGVSVCVRRTSRLPAKLFDSLPNK